jgi:hypothetical protein
MVNYTIDFSPPSPDGRNFLCGECGSFLERAIIHKIYPFRPYGILTINTTAVEL